MKRLSLLLLAGCSSFSVGLYDEPAVLARHPGLRGIIVPAESYVPGKSQDSSPERWSSRMDLRISAGDRLRISIQDHPELERTVPVAPDGKVDLPLVGRIVTAGRTVGELRSDLAAQFGKSFQNPQVEVAVAEPDPAGGVQVVGMTNFEGRLEIERAKDVQTALNMAGGASTFACLPQFMVVRPGERKVIVCDYYAFIRNGDKKQNLPLRTGDVLVVPENYPESVPCAKEWAPIEQYFKGSLDHAGLVKALKTR